MNRPTTRRRGARMVPAKDIAFPNESVVLVHRLYGRIVATIRASLEVSQQELADAMHMPASTVSKLEKGGIVVGIYHLDVLASAANELGKEILGVDPAWQGWELHRLADEIGHRIEKDGYMMMWSAPDDSDGAEIVPERKVGALVRVHWPESLRRRIGW